MNNSTQDSADSQDACGGWPGQPTALIKIGGSLLDWPQLAQAWRHWIAQRSAESPQESAATTYWLLAGGGEWVEQIRQLQLRRDWSDVTAHWLAIQALGITAHVLAHRLHLPIRPLPSRRSSQIPASVDEPHHEGIRVVVINPSWYLRTIEPVACEPRLAADWTVTSDTIAVRLAQLWGIRDVWLAKSCRPPTTSAKFADFQHWAETGFVDAGLPSYLAPSVKLSTMNLRDFA